MTLNSRFRSILFALTATSSAYAAADPACEGLKKLTLDHAARLHDCGDAHWRYFANAAMAFGGEALRCVALQTQHTFGAIGYAEEHEAPRHFRRVHADLVRFGCVARARAELADFLLGPVQ